MSYKSQHSPQERLSKSTFQLQSDTIGPWHKISEAAKYMGDVSERKVREWVASGRLKHRRIDGILYFSIKWMDEFMIFEGTEDKTKANKIDEIVEDVLHAL